VPSAPTEAELLRYAVRASRRKCRQDSAFAADPLSVLSSPLINSSILVADDDADTRALIMHLLKKAGYEVLEAEDGEQVLAMLRERVPGLVLLD